MPANDFDSTPDLPLSTETSTTQPLSPNRSDVIESYRRLALTKSNPLAANLAVINCDLMAFANENAISIARSVPQPGGPADDPQQFERQIDLHLRLARQIDRLARIDLQLDATDSEPTCMRKSRKLIPNGFLRVGDEQPEPTGSN